MRTIARSGNIKSKTKPKKKLAFDAQAFLDSAGVARKVKEFTKAELVYSQGDTAQSVMYIQEGGVKLTVVNEVGKEAVVAILAPGDFFGEGCLAGQSVRMARATAITPSTVLVIDKSEMFKVLHEQHALSDRFIKFMLARNIRVEEDLVDHRLPPFLQEVEVRLLHADSLVPTSGQVTHYFKPEHTKLSRFGGRCRDAAGLSRV
jgi:CRP-like cAMP-binding protein